MNNESTRYLELLEQRITLLHSLSGALLEAGASMVAFDIDGLESRIAHQRQLCGAIGSLDDEMERLQYQCAAHLRLNGVVGGEEGAMDLQDALLRLHQAQSAVKKLNTAHQALVHRSKRTVTALLNSLQTFQGSYREAALQ